MRIRNRKESKGFVMIFVLLVLVLLSAATVGVVYLVNTDMRAGGSDLHSMQAYYGAEAAMEKMIADLSRLYVTRLSPTVSEIQALDQSQPQIDYVSYPRYEINVANTGGVPDAVVRNISAGPNEGLVAAIIPMELDVTSRGPARTEVRMLRGIEVALIPVFQFGIFSDSDLSYYPGPGFDFGGRVHTNGNLFLSTRSSLTFRSKVSAAGEIVRMELANGINTVAAGRDRPVHMPTAPGGCDGSRPACRNLAVTEGSVVAGPASAENPNWTNISTSIYNGMVVNGKTGARPLELPFVDDSLRSIEIIRRPGAVGEGPLVTESRLYGQAQILVLLNDLDGELPVTGVRLANMPPYFDGSSYGESDTAFAEGNQSVDGHFVRPAGVGAGDSWPLVDGYLAVLVRQDNGLVSDVTMEWLNLGIARENPDAILRFQSLKDNNGNGVPDYEYTEENRADPHKWLQLNLYDAREGEVRDYTLGANNDSCAIGGIFNVIELEVNNLRRWLEGEIGETGGSTDSAAQNGYILYFSDQRGTVADSDGRKGSYGYEDVVNAEDPAGAADGVLGEGEDLNENGVLDNWGVLTLGDGFFPEAQGGLTAYDDPRTRVPGRTIGRKNRVTGPRRALKLVNGAVGNLPTTASNGGFTIASENPVYVQGDYNAQGAFTNDYVPAAIIADSVTLLSNSWEDWRSFADATWVGGGTRRRASNTWYRMAVAAGKVDNFPNPSWTGSDEYGLDGGTHNFLRYLEDWSGRSLNYRGSLVSLFYSEYANGIYKCCATVYRPPSRNYAFETDFLTPSKLPPGTPRFRDIVTLGFQQILSVD